MAWGKKSSGGGGCVAWLALIVAIAALVLAWKAYERTGGKLPDVLEMPIGDSAQARDGGGIAGEVSESAEMAKARARLLARRAEVATQRNLQQVQDEVGEIRGELQRSYENAGTRAREGWAEVDADLERLQAQLRAGSSRAVETLDTALDKMRRLGREDG